VSGFVLAAVSIGMLFWFDRKHPIVSPEHDRKLGAMSDPSLQSPVSSLQPEESEPESWGSGSWQETSEEEGSEEGSPHGS
jgi:hypothetical protein